MCCYVGVDVCCCVCVGMCVYGCEGVGMCVLWWVGVGAGGCVGGQVYGVFYYVGVACGCRPWVCAVSMLRGVAVLVMADGWVVVSF